MNTKSLWDSFQDGPTAHVAALTSELQTLQHRLAQESQTLKEAQERLESSEAKVEAAEEVFCHGHLISVHASVQLCSRTAQIQSKGRGCALFPAHDPIESSAGERGLHRLGGKG